LNLPAGTPILTGIFRLSGEKQPFLFLKVVELLHRKLPALKVILAGEGALFVEIQHTIRQKNLEKTVHLLGRRDDVAALMKVSDVFLLTSKQEGTPNVVLEAQYLGVPVVATRVGGVPDAMLDGVTGFLCSPDDPEEIAGKCLDLLKDRNKRRTMGRAGSDFIRTHFSLQSMVDKTLEALCR
jgi:glycosyltransferase involved in cell wall biosynthesis